MAQERLGQKLVNFDKAFTLPVSTGAKRQTIRRVRKRPIRRGDTLRLYSGLRQGGKATLLGVHKCVGVDPITIDDNGVTIAGEPVLASQLDHFARMDGFGNWHEMRDWFKARYKNLPFVGVIIFW